MKKNWMKRAAAAVLTAAMGAGLCACGGETSTETGSKHYFNTSYIDQVPENFSRIGTALFKGDELYYSAYSEDYNSTGIYAFNLVEETEHTILEMGGVTNEDGVMLSSKSINYFTVDEEGNIYAYVSASDVDEESLNQDYSDATLDDVLAFMVDSWGYDENEAAQDWDSWYKESYMDEEGNVNYGAFLLTNNLTYIDQQDIQKLDKDGNVLYSVELPENGEDYYTSCFGIAVDGDGNLYCGMNTWMYDGSSDLYYIDVYDSEGNKKGQIDCDGWTSSMLTLSDGRVGCISYTEETELIILLDADSLSASESYQINAGSIQPYEGNVVLMNEGGTLYLYDLEDQSKETYLTWMDCNISSSSVNSYGMLSDGTLGVFTQTWTSTGSSSEIAILTEVDESEVVKTETINVACMWLDSDIEALAIEFNKKHEEYHISITEYYDDTAEDWDAMLASFTTAVANDPNIDIVIFNDYSQVTNFASKGLMTDLYEFIDNDQDLSREDFLPNILEACEFDGELLTLPKSFYLSTVVGKAEDVGTEPGWTIEDMKNLLASKPEGTQLFYGMTRSEALSACLSLGYRDFIDTVNATCSFDTQEFVDVLEFANMFPEEFTYEDDVDETELLNSGQVLLSTYWLYDLDEIQLYTAVFGGDLTYIGYPTSEGNGALLSLTNLYGITSSCENKEAAWEFVRQFYVPSGESWYSGFSTRTDEFEKACEQMMDKDENDAYSYGWGNYEVEIRPTTQEQVDELKDLVYNTTAVSGAVSEDITNLILEEAAYYFSGEQTAEEVAAKIQSRMEIYLSETK